MNYFISYTIKSKDPMMSPITHYGNVIMDLPHAIKDESDIIDIQNHLAVHFENSVIIILWFNKLEE